MRDKRIETSIKWSEKFIERVGMRVFRRMSRYGLTKKDYHLWLVDKVRAHVEQERSRLGWYRVLQDKNFRASSLEWYRDREFARLCRVLVVGSGR